MSNRPKPYEKGSPEYEAEMAEVKKILRGDDSAISLESKLQKSIEDTERKLKLVQERRQANPLPPRGLSKLITWAILVGLAMLIFG